VEFGQTKSRRNHYILRWVAVLPGAILAVLVVMFPIHWLVMHQYTDYGEGSLRGIISPRTLETLANAFFTPFIFVVSGSAIAPKFKYSTGIALALLLFPVYVWIGTVILSDVHQRPNTLFQWFRLGVTVLLWLAGFVFGLRQAKKSQNEMASG
jgi:ABC-type sugar transport system permease subunit